MMIGMIAVGLAAAADCRHIGRHAYIRVAPLVARPGDRMTLSFVYRDGPDGEKAVPLQCLQQLRVKGRAALERERVVRITGDAASGDKVRVVARIGDSEVLADITVTGRDEQVLAGQWSQASAEHCYGRRLAELIFTADGRYSYTFPEQAFETMVSGTGSYRWDPATGALALGNYKGIARRDGGTLTIEGIDIEGVPPVYPPGEAPPDAGPCRIVLTGG
jgi:hypothetical protein